MERLERGFRVERWHMNAPPPPFHKKVIKEKDQNVDRRNIGHMHIPGNFFLFTLFSPAGSGAEKGNLEGAKEYRNCQFMTPETRRTTHHFWIYLNNFEGSDSTISRSLHASLIEGFLEDKHIIEAQQRAMDEDPDFKLLAVVADAPLAHFRRTLDQLIAKEQADQAERLALGTASGAGLRLTSTMPAATPQSASTS